MQSAKPGTTTLDTSDRLINRGRALKAPQYPKQENWRKQCESGEFLSNKNHAESRLASRLSVPDSITSTAPLKPGAGTESRSASGHEQSGTQASRLTSSATRITGPRRSPISMQRPRLWQFPVPFVFFPSSFPPVRGRVRHGSGGSLDLGHWAQDRRFSLAPISGRRR